MLQSDDVNRVLDLIVYGEYCLLRWICIQLPLELGDVVSIVHHDIEPHRQKDAFVIKVGYNFIRLLVAGRGNNLEIERISVGYH